MTEYEGDWVEPTRVNLGTIGTCLIKMGQNIEEACDDTSNTDLAVYMYVLTQLNLVAELAERNGPQVAKLVLLEMTE